MKQITFITPAELKEVTIIQDNVNEKILNIAIREFQELELEPLLGKSLYRRLSNELVLLKTITTHILSDDDTDLMRYIKPFLVYGTLLNSFGQLHYSVTNKGVQKLQDSNAVNADRGDIAALKSTYTSKVDAYKARLIDYMATDDVPETNSSCSDNDTTFNFTGISMGDSDYDWETAYKNSAYKTGYYRRRLF
jgi:hypothetical protein